MNEVSRTTDKDLNADEEKICNAGERYDEDV